METINHKYDTTQENLNTDEDHLQTARFKYDNNEEIVYEDKPLSTARPYE